VGSVILDKHGQLAGGGFHPYAGALHAERFALSEAGPRAKGGTLYVTLEPCCHQGRTPACTDAILQAGVERVVVITVDPNPKVQGQGIRQLQKAGVQVELLPEEDSLSEQAQQLNEIFFTYHMHHRPFITLKAAMSMDGKIATPTGDSKWITGERARRYAHRLRAEHGAVLVGINTVLQDDPQLTARLRGVHHQPLRVVLDTSLRVPESAQLLHTDAPTLIVCREGDADKIKRLRAGGVEIYRQKGVSNTGIDLQDLTEYLYKKGITGILVEGGGAVIASFLEAGLGDKAVFFYAPLLIGGREARTAVEGLGASFVTDGIRLSNVQIRRFGKDWAVSGYLPGVR
jgi:diaminohydroxyphosphoribosylaminopyrimidine deaminase/5-amino-6-(5-phosphoribosylamino)uracil reductase